MAERARRHHRLCAAGLCGEDVLPGEFDRNALVMRGGMKAAAFVAPAVVDRLAAEDFGKLFQRRIVAGIDKAISARRPGDVAAIKRRDRKTGQRIARPTARSRSSPICSCSTQRKWLIRVRPL